ncbi:hypothetical protein [Macrococcoides caseolyticum]|uniref:Uncharacterized protein n=1 Tax=Macrococcus psychrotolerans TaxID=3039389 RepID=A0AAT9P9U5_9STAP|nr:MULTISPECIES: hypothetical protein [Macrococcus]MDJ1089857.1 hypothetical protein [Macrococcus caseolyticus]QYA34145.1 hypothetical protein KYI10_12325 [Macrococcus sp. 19Msa1099]QYA38946.1 hypothetical protein KYI07_12305 [Macrococcus caseolyticus]QYA41178.1 hypothetical protein KYI09_11420 [Macrococcus caseolyticus]QYA77653.1 hypothetical protein KYI12_12310 [Macrococcus caseolyticus]
MGLDMYIVKEEDGRLDEIAYFRKFNALHGYFDERYYLGNPGRVKLDNYMVEDVYDRLIKIIEAPEKASNLLPTYMGPFFGGYDYDDIYYHYIAEAFETFHKLKQIDVDKENYYYMADY